MKPNPQKFAARYADAGFNHADRLLPSFANPDAEGVHISGHSGATATELAHIYRVRAEIVAEFHGLKQTAKELEEICDVLEAHPTEIVRLWSVDYEEDGKGFLVFELPAAGILAGATLTPRRWAWR